MKTSLISCLLLFVVGISFAQPGALDPSFDPGDGFTSTVYSIELLDDGKILVGGAFWEFNGVQVPRITRLNADGSLDPGFATGPGFDYFVYQTITLNDGKILVCGAFSEFIDVSRKNIARLHNNGTLDQSFDPGSGFNNSVEAMALQSDGKIIAAGGFTQYDGEGATRIARLHPNGEFDGSFTPGSGFDQFVYTLALQDDGKILAGGEFTSYNGVTVNKLARLNPDGSIDNSFNIGSGFNGTVWSVAVQDDGKILVGGSFTAYQGTTRNFIARLNADGTLDASFNPGSGFDNYVLSIAIQEDGKIFAGGLFNASQGVQSYRVARLHPDGTHDTSFDPGTGLNSQVFVVAAQADNKVLAGGTFTAYYNVTRNQIIRLQGAEEVTSIGIPDQNLHLSLYPNPGKNRFYLAGEIAVPFVEVMDFSGKIVAKINVDSDTVAIDLANQPAGNYYVKAGDRILKLIKQ